MRSPLPIRSIDFWFEACDFTESPLTEWNRQVVAAVSCVRQVMLDTAPRHFVEILVGSVNDYPRFRGAKHWPTVECVSFRGELPEKVDGELRALGTSRQLSVTSNDPVAASSLASWAFLVDGAVLLRRSYGRANELEWSYLLAAPVLCVRNESELPDIRVPDEAMVRTYLSTRQGAEGGSHASRH